jgi:hypothetical protein
MLNRFRLPAAVLLATVLCPAQEYIDQVVERARKEFDVPGIAVAIVKDGKVVLAKGYGVRKLGEAAPVTTQSLFRIASNTKAFTSAALAAQALQGTSVEKHPERILVVVELSGGNDGLNTVVPFGDAAYYRALQAITKEHQESQSHASLSV